MNLISFHSGKKGRAYYCPLDYYTQCAMSYVDITEPAILKICLIKEKSYGSGLIYILPFEL